MFQTARTHYHFQTRLKGAVDKLVLNHPDYLRHYQSQQLRITDDSDLYQGSRALADLISSIQERIDEKAAELDAQCSRTISALSTAQPEEVPGAIEAVHKYLRVLVFPSKVIRANQEKYRVAQIIQALRHHPHHLVAKVVLTTPPPATFADLRKGLADLPSRPAGSSFSTGYLASASAFFSRAGPPPPAPQQQHYTHEYVAGLKRRHDHYRDLLLKSGRSTEDLKLPHPSPPGEISLCEHDF